MTALPPTSVVQPQAANPDGAILVAGTGPAGLVAALALAAAGAAVTLVGPAVPAENAGGDRRTTALFGGSVELLRHLGVWPRVQGAAARLVGLRIVDDTGGLLRAPETVFQAREAGLPEFGWNIPNSALLAGLAAVVQETAAIEWRVGAVAGLSVSGQRVEVVLADGSDWTGALVAAADGRNSTCRRLAAIAAHSSPYPQSALVARFSHSRPHAGISSEFHRRAGPLTTVPLAGAKSALVWVEGHAEAQRLASLDDTALLGELETRLQGLLGIPREISHRGVHPLTSLHAETLARNRVALIGEAAHVIPPIGAQGLNLGFRDAAWLADITEKAAREGRDIGGEAALAAYTAARRSDIATRSMAVDALNRSLLADLLPLDLARGAGLVALARLPWLKQVVMRAGIGPAGALPRLLQPAPSF